MKNPLISIYITNYNYAAYIKKSVESLLSQTFQNYELFIIDDGSTDNSKEIIEEYAQNPKISIIYQHNKGLNVTNNIALRVSRGKYIMRLDADDFLENKALELMSEILEKDEELGLVFPDYFLCDADDNIIGEVKRLNFKSEVSLLDQPAHGACTMIRRDFLVNLGGYDETYSCQDGYELWIKFISHYKVLNINLPLFSYRQHGNNLTKNENRILETRFKIKDNFILNNNIPTPPTLAIIPVRNTFLNGNNIPLEKLNDKSLLEITVKAALESKKITHVVITSSDSAIKQYFEQNLAKLSSKLSFISRPESYARINESLNNTIFHVLEQPSVKNLNVEAIMTLSIEFPFISSDIIDDAVNTMTIFGADSLISVRPDNSIYYQHDGNGLHPILHQEKFTKLEREAIYKSVGGIVLSKLSGLVHKNKMLHGKVGHIVINVNQALGIFSDFDLMLARKLTNL